MSIGRIVVSSVVEKSQAEESRQVEKGDEIVQVNYLPLDGYYTTYIIL